MLWVLCVVVEVKQGKRKLDSASHLAISESLPLPILSVAEINAMRQHFIFEGLILNIYGTYDTDREWRYLRTDLTDRIGFDTVTLVAWLAQIIMERTLAK